MSVFVDWVHQTRTTGHSPSGTVGYVRDKFYIIGPPQVLYGQLFATGAVFIPPPDRDTVVHKIQLLKEIRAAGRLACTVPKIEPLDHPFNLDYLLTRARKWGKTASGGKKKWYDHYEKYQAVVSELDWYCKQFKLSRPPVLTQDELDALAAHLMFKELTATAEAQ